jgi:quercetin dioxygenase-like cupin family protein
MVKNMSKSILSIGLFGLALVFAGALVGAQQAGFKRTELQRHDLSVAGREAVQMIAELPKGTTAPRHTHPGEEIGYVLEGTVVMEIEGDAPVTLKAGEVFFIPAGRAHSVRNTGETAAKALSTFVIEKGKPLAAPAPEKTKP